MKRYKFKELPKEVQEEIIEEVANQNNEFFSDFIDEFWYAWFLTECKNNGFIVDVEDIQWSGFNSQGDGASFEGKIFIKNFCEKKGLKIPKNITEDDYLDICRASSHYVHENTCYIENMYDEEKEIDDKILSYMEETRVELCHDLYNGLYNYWCELTSVDYCRKYIINIDYYYTISGDIISSLTDNDYFDINSETIKKILEGIDREIIIDDNKITIQYKDQKENILLFIHSNEKGWDFKLDNLNYFDYKSDKNINIIFKGPLINNIYNDCYIDGDELDKIEFNNKILYIDDKELNIKNNLKKEAK